MSCFSVYYQVSFDLLLHFFFNFKRGWIMKIHIFSKYERIESSRSRNLFFSVNTIFSKFLYFIRQAQLLKLWEHLSSLSARWISMLFFLLYIKLYIYYYILLYYIYITSSDTFSPVIILESSFFLNLQYYILIVLLKCDLFFF